MGLIVLAIAVMPLLGIGGGQLYKTEIPGAMNDQKLTPRIKETAQALWLIYLVLTIFCALFYYFAGMGWFDAVSHSLSTVSIGGFSTHNESIGYFNNGFIEATSEGIISDKNSFIALKKDNQVQDIIYTNLLYSKDVFELIKNSLGEQPYSYSQNINLSILSEVIKPNVSYDNEFTQKVIDESVNEISLSKGKVSVGELIILKGDIVEGKKMAILFSLKGHGISTTKNEVFFIFSVL